MDPLSLVASIAGVMIAAGHVSKSATAMIAAWKDAPRSANSIVSEMASLKACLTSLMPFLRSLDSVARSRTASISVEQIVVIASSCVLNVSELQRMMDELGPQHSLPWSVKFRWRAHEKKIGLLINRIQTSTASLNLLLTALTCSHADETQRSLVRLERTVTEIRNADPNLSERLSRTDTGGDYQQYAGSTLQETSDDSDEASLAPVLEKLPLEPDLPVITEGVPAFGLDAEVQHDLSTSFPYKRANKRGSMSSDSLLTSDALSRPGWSFVSGVSLAQCSNLSVLSLPIATSELWKPKQYGPQPSSHPKRPIMAQVRSISEQAGFNFSQSGSKELVHRPALKTHKSNKAAPEHHILLRGISQAGKTTLLTQMRLIYADGYDSSERLDFLPILISNLLDGFKVILKEVSDAADTKHHAKSSGIYETLLLELKDETQHIKSALTMKNLWEDHGIQDLVRSSNTIVLPDNFHHWVYNFYDLAHRGNLATDHDILHAWVKTTGMHTATIPTTTQVVCVSDAGGVRAERKKWYSRPQPKGPTSVIYIAPLTGYSQPLREDEESFQYQESLLLFQSLLETHHHTSHPFTLILSKSDLLPQRLTTHTFSCHSTLEYTGEVLDTPAVIEHIKMEFVELARKAEKELRVFVVDLTDTESVKVVLGELIGGPIGVAF